MSFDWSEYFIVAQELANQAITSSKNQGTIEAKLRCAISRAYYAAFRKARNHLRDKEGEPLHVLTHGNTHQVVINLFNTGSDIDRLMIAQFLHDLRSARNRADYDDTLPNLLGLTATALLQAEQVLALLNIL